MVNKKILTSGLVFGVVIASIAGIGLFNYYNSLKRPYDRIIIDSLGRSVGLYNATYIDRIVGINPGALRLLVYMEAENLVCGVEDVEKIYSARPYTYACPELASLPSIGPQFGGTPELILAQQPDVIFSTSNFFTAEDADRLQSLTGIPVVAITDGLTGDINDLLNSLDIIAEVLDKEERADSLRNITEDLLFDLNNRTKDIDDGDKPWIYIGGIGYHGTHGITSTECQYSPLEFINGKNSAENITIGHAFIDIEQLFEWEDPETDTLDYIIVDGGGYTMCMTDLKNKTAGAGAGDLDCTNEERLVMTLPYNWYSHNYATIFVDAYYLGMRFFPEQFSDLDYTNGNVYNDIYEKFVGKRVYENMANEYIPGYEGFHNITHSEIAAA